MFGSFIAMIKLPKDVRINRLSPVCLPKSSQTMEGVRCMATGWGQTEFGGELQSHLQQVELRVVDNVICEEKYGNRYNISIHPYHLCAGPLIKGGKGTCVGDSGGPLHCNMKDGKWYLAGITSFGSGCGKPGYPDVFTRLASFMPWVSDIIAQEEAFSEGFLRVPRNLS